MDDRTQIFQKGIGFLNQGKPDQAIAHLAHYLKSDGQGLDAIYNLAIAFFHRGRFQETIHFLSVLRTLLPGNLKILNNLGSAFRNNRQPEEAKECFESALKIAPEDPDVLSNLGILLQEMGSFKEARSCLEKTIAVNEGHINALKSLCEIKRFEKDDPLFTRMEALKRKDGLPLRDKMTLCFASGKMYADIEAYDPSFENYSMANTLRDKIIGGKSFSIQHHRQYVDTLIQSVTPEFIENLAVNGSHSRSPIFIVGMPRSGATLVEQILSSHSMVFGAGELTAISRFHARLTQTNEKAAAHECLEPGLVKAFADEYLGLTQKLSGNAPFITDKFPQNFLYLWLIAALFPKARIIHIRRDPVDTCLSCYFHNFAFGHEYKHQLDWLGEYYKEYQKLMGHWEQVLAVPILSISYEDIIADQEAAVTRLLEFCELDVEQRCMECHKQNRNIAGSSRSHVGRPIYKTSVGRWKAYEKHLAPLLAALNETNE